MVEILGGALAGGAVEDKLASRNWGSLLLALDPALAGNGDVAAFQVRLMPCRAPATILANLATKLCAAARDITKLCPALTQHQPGTAEVAGAGERTTSS